MRARNITWWLAFLYIGISAQNAFPGLDVLVIGLLVALQERRIMQFACLLPVLVLIQEGGGTLDFGASLLWYSAVIALFFVGHWLFEVENMVIMFMLSACIGAAHMGVVQIMAVLQSTPIDRSLLLDESVLQALLIGLAWRPLSWTRRVLVLSHEDPN